VSWTSPARHLIPGLALHLTPDANLILFTLGLLLIYIELNRPGAILPGALGLTVALLSVASLSRFGLQGSGLVLVGTASALLLLDLFRRTPVVVAIAATLALCLGFGHIVAGPVHTRVQSLTAAACGIVLGAGTSVLTRLARRARANKALD
jgi:membrane-bound serine protease (ClpP class)